MAPDGVGTQTAATLSSHEEPDRLFQRWLDFFGPALERGDVPAVTGAFVENGYWRDILALDWAYNTYTGREEIGPALEHGLAEAQIQNVRRAPGRMAPRLAKRSGLVVVEAFFELRPPSGGASASSACCPRVPGSGRRPIWILLTALQELRGFPRSGSARAARPESSSRRTSPAPTGWTCGSPPAATPIATPRC